MVNQIILGSIVILSAGFIQGITGFGLSLFALPLLGLIFGLRDTVPILVLLSIVTNLWIAKDHVGKLEFRSIAKILLPAIIGVPFGIWMLAFVSPGTLKILAGTVITAFAVSTALDFSFMKHSGLRSPVLFGFLSGVLNGSISLSGPPIVAYFTNENFAKDFFRSNISAYFLLLNLCTLGAMAWQGVCGTTHLRFFLLLLPGLLLGTILGNVTSTRINEATFRKLAIGLLFVTGIYTVVA
jgi:uncharacterized protein